MKLSKRKARVLSSAIQDWENNALITPEQAKQLRRSYQIVGFDWRLLAVYSFWIAITCLIIAVGVLLADDYLLALLAQIIDTPASVLALLSAGIAAACYIIGTRRRDKYPEKNISNEATFFFGVFMTAVTVAFLRETSGIAHRYDALLLLLLTLVYGVLGIRLSSILIWLFALISFGAWEMVQTYELASPEGYFLGMNQALRFVFVGIAVLAVSRYTERRADYQYLSEPTLFVGLLYLLSTLWLLSIFGNYADATEWADVPQFHLLPWSILAGLVCLGVIYLGIRFDNPLCRSFGITFLLINLYTRYFEYFWESMHKTIFFAILALSFWVLGTKAEKLWQLGRQLQSESQKH
ncbi:hypothetical protein VV869_20485 [Photobacterium sp. MCCC 1A19761]|uniref:hypothetical protein n=1 Tax=Photobacterium sp. MCCC 1A19761 TaxID=3115000 RepID=UPI00307FB729